MSHVRPVSTWLGKRLKLRNVRVPLTNNEQIRVAPGESTSNPKASPTLGTLPFASTGFGLPGTTYGAGPSPVKGVPTGKPCPHWPALAKNESVGRSPTDISKVGKW